MSAGNAEDRAAYEALGEEDYRSATVHALLAIRAELRTANLVAVAQVQSLPLLDDGWAPSSALSYPDAAALRAEIREELDIDVQEPTS